MSAVLINPYIRSQSYDEMILEHAPYLFYKLDETSGTVATDLSGNGRHGTYSGSPALATRSIGDWACCDFDGSNDFVTTPAFSVSGWAGVTLECWCIADVALNGTGIMNQIYSGSGDVITLMMGAEGGAGATTFQLSRWSGSAWQQASTGAPLATATVHHLVGTLSAAGTGVLYRNGAQVATGAMTYIADADAWYIGRRYNGESTLPFFNGAIARAAMYDRAITSDEVLAHYQRGVF